MPGSSSYLVVEFISLLNMQQPMKTRIEIIKSKLNAKNRNQPFFVSALLNDVI